MEEIKITPSEYVQLFPEKFLTCSDSETGNTFSLRYHGKHVDVKEFVVLVLMESFKSLLRAETLDYQLVETGYGLVYLNVLAKVGPMPWPSFGLEADIVNLAQRSLWDKSFKNQFNMILKYWFGDEDRRPWIAAATKLTGYLYTRELVFVQAEIDISSAPLVNNEKVDEGLESYSDFMNMPFGKNQYEAEFSFIQQKIEEVIGVFMKEKRLDFED